MQTTQVHVKTLRTCTVWPKWTWQTACWILDQVFGGQRKRKNFIVWLQSPNGGPSIRVNAKTALKEHLCSSPGQSHVESQSHHDPMGRKWYLWMFWVPDQDAQLANNPVMTKADRGILNSRNRNLTTRDRLHGKPWHASERWRCVSFWKPRLAEESIQRSRQSPARRFDVRHTQERQLWEAWSWKLVDWNIATTSQ